jgi:PAS domain S-box-containing protein
MQNVRVLVVEDESIVAEDLREQLASMGNTVLGPVATGEQAVYVAEHDRPDLVLMDIRLQGRTDGIEAADQIRGKCHIPVVYLTSHADDDTLERAKKTQPQGYLLKPFEENDLRVNIELALAKHAAENRLRESEQRLATTLASIGDGVIATDERGRVTFMNPVAERLTHWTAAEASGRPLEQIFRIINEMTRQPRLNPMLEAMRRGTTVDLEQGTLLIAKNGREIPVADCAAPIHGPQGQLHGGVLVFRDITEKRNVEEAERKAQEHRHWLDRLEAIGRFASGMAHEINNMLTVVLGCGELLLSQLGPDHGLRPSLDAMISMGDRTTTLIRQLLAFSRKQHLTPALVNFNDVLQRLRIMFARLLSAQIELIMHPDPGLAPVFVDRLQWEQVFVNLALNARDAMPNGGTLTVETRNVQIDEQFTSRHPEMTPGAYVRVTVKDTGAGMDDATQAHLFEPFFTTKPFGMGTGLGLATVYGIVTQSGGHIFVESAPGKGSAFSMYLPAATPESAAPRPVLSSLTVPRGRETVLLAEDEEAVRLWIARALRDLGYFVLEATNGQDALEIAGQFDNSIHLLLTDVVMPKIPGPGLAKRLVKDRTNLKVLYMSAYSDEAAYPPELREGKTFLQKPFTASALAWKVRAVLDEGDA